MAQGSIVHYELLPDVTMVNSELYCQQLDHVQEQLRRGTSEWKRRTTPLLLHDNARPHVARLTQQKIVGKFLLTQLTHQIALLLTTTYSDHWSTVCEGYASLIKMRSKNTLMAFWQQTSGFFERGIGLLTEKWQKIVDNNGSYFE